MEGNLPMPHQAENPLWREQRDQILRSLELPIEVSGLRWHPFGVYTMPLAKRRDEQGTWSRRLHLWHPKGKPVGPYSPYGVHTHSGLARSSLLHGSVIHHLYAFAEDEEGIWIRSPAPGQARATLLDHTQAETRKGQIHELDAHQPHGVSTGSPYAVSLFEQRDGPVEQPFTTWQRQDGPAEELIRTPPVPVAQIQQEFLQELYASKDL